MSTERRTPPSAPVIGGAAPRIDRLPNGIPVLSHTVPGLRGAALGLWLLNGSRWEQAGQYGHAHFLEHILFKGAGALDAAALTARFEAMGGDVNAMTGRELTALHGLVPGERLPELVGLFADMLMAPRFGAADVARERGVVLQEMAMVADNPEDLMEQEAVAAVWPGSGLGRPILGRVEDLEGLEADTLRAYLAGVACAGRVLVVATGAVDHDALMAACAPLARLPAGPAPFDQPPVWHQGEAHIQGAFRQGQLAWLMPLPAPADPDYAARVLANHLLGGSWGSRLFQSLRERQGLVYSIHSSLEFNCDSGLWWIQTACDTARIDHCRQAVEAEVRRFLEEGPAPGELDQARQHLRAQLALEEDDADARMGRLAREWFYLGRNPTLEERLAALDAVAPERIVAVLDTAWRQASRFSLGPADAPGG